MVPEVIARMLEAAEALDAEIKPEQPRGRSAFLLKARVFLDNAINNASAALALPVPHVVKAGADTVECTKAVEGGVVVDRPAEHEQD